MLFVQETDTISFTIYFIYLFIFLLYRHVLKDSLSEKQLMFFFAKCLEIQETIGYILLIRAIFTLEPDPVPEAWKTIVVS